MIIICPTCEHPMVLLNGRSRTQGQCNVCETVVEVSVYVIKNSPMTAEEIEGRRNVNRQQARARAAQEQKNG